MTDDYELGLTMRPLNGDQMQAFFDEQERAGVQGRWVGGGAANLGLTGPIQPGELEAFYSPDPAAALARLRASNAMAAQYGPTGYAPAPPRGMSIAGMVLGLASVVFGLVLIVPVVGVILSVVGLRREPAGRGMAIAGIVLNGIFLAGWLLLAALGFGLFGALFAGAASSTL